MLELLRSGRGPLFVSPDAVKASLDEVPRSEGDRIVEFRQPEPQPEPIPLATLQGAVAQLVEHNIGPDPFGYYYVKAPNEAGVLEHRRFTVKLPALEVTFVGKRDAFC